MVRRWYIKRWYIIVILILLVSNGATLGFLMQKLSSTAKLPEIEKKWEAFTLNGQSRHWQVEDFKIIRTASSIFRGNGSLKYIGSLDEVEATDYFGYAFFEQPDGGKPKPVLSHAETSSGGSMDISNALRHLGSIQGAITDWELAETREDLSQSYMEVSWKDAEGMIREEHIPMSVTEAYSSME